MAIIYAFGDSITYGSWDPERGGWVNRLRKDLDAEQEKNPLFYALAYNLGIPGETTEGLVKRLQAEAEARSRQDQDEEHVFIFAFGANDSAIRPSKNNFAVDIKKFGQNIASAIETAQKFSNKILLLNITPVIDELTVKPVNKDKSRLNEYVQKYNEELKKVATLKNIPLLDIFSAFMEKGHVVLLDADDGLHPNAAGHEIIYQMVREQLGRMLDL